MMVSSFAAILIQQPIFRNIVRLHPRPFADLTQNNKEANQIFTKLQMRIQSESLDYTEAIGYPFETDHFMSSRFSDGSFPIWYGALDEQTTFHETAYHILRRENAVNIAMAKVIIKPRSIFKVNCDSHLIDFTKHKELQTKLRHDDYAYTQKIAKNLYQQGYPGLLAPSVRHKKGVIVNIFKQEILSQPIIVREVTYHVYKQEKRIDIFENKTKLDSILYT